MGGVCVKPLVWGALGACLFASSIQAQTTPAPIDTRVDLKLNTDPQGAVMLVLPKEPGAKPFQCVTPCSVRIPQGWTFQLIATKPGYIQISHGQSPQWAEVGHGLFKPVTYALVPSEVTIKLAPDPNEAK